MQAFICKHGAFVTEEFIKYIRPEKVKESIGQFLRRKYPNAYLLLTQIAEMKTPSIKRSLYSVPGPFCNSLP
jgi:hypothetical protein